MSTRFVPQDTQSIPGIGTDTDYRNAAAALAESRLFQPPLPPPPPKIPLLESPPSKPNAPSPLALLSPFVDILGNTPGLLPQPHSKQSPRKCRPRLQTTTLPRMSPFHYN